MKPIRLFVASLLTVLCCLSTELLGTDNLIFNGSFELGTAGFECNKYLHIETNPTMTYEGPVIDSTTSVSGSNSLKIPNHYSEAINLFARNIVLKPSTKYTISLSMKSTVAALPVAIIICRDDWAFSGNNAGNPFQVGTAWKRFTLTFTRPATSSGHDIIKTALNPSLI